MATIPASAAVRSISGTSLPSLGREQVVRGWLRTLRKREPAARPSHFVAGLVGSAIVVAVGSSELGILDSVEVYDTGIAPPPPPPVTVTSLAATVTSLPLSGGEKNSLI